VTAATAPTAARPAVAERGDRLLAAAATLFAVAVVIHNSDHLRRGIDSVRKDVFWVGTAGILVEVGIVVLVLARHRVAPLAAVAVGWSLAPAYVLVHFLPERSWLSDSLPSGVDVSAMTWFAASLEVVAAFALGLAGWIVLQQRGGLASAAQPHAEQRPVREGVLHPVALVMLLANVVIVAASLAQL
jgi:hypothetical protein